MLGSSKRRTRWYGSLVAASSGTLAAVAAAVLLAPVSADAAVKPARGADAFVDSIGVNVHLGYTDTAYKDYPFVKQKLGELGVRHARDMAYLNEPPDRREVIYGKCRDLAASSVKFDLIFNDPVSAETMGQIGESTRGALEAIEGPNEPDINKNRPADWASVTRSEQVSIYKAAKANPSTANVPVIGPSIAVADNVKYVMDPDGDGVARNLGRYLDYGNIHSYMWAQQPFAPGTRMDNWRVPQARKLAGDKPLIATETGYNAAAGDQSNGGPVSESVMAKYTTRSFLEHYKRGFERTYAYELIDQFPDPEKDEREKNWGLLRNDGTKKPAFVALENTIDLLQDPGKPFKTGSLNYSLSGDTDNVRQLLLQKRNGRFYLVLWLAVSSYNTSTDENIAVPSQRVTLDLSTPVTRAITYRPNRSTEPAASYGSPKRLAVSVSDQPLIIELRPAS